MSGIRVIELGSSLSLAKAGADLAQLGAEVVKVELPGHPDVVRRLGTYVEGWSPAHVQLGANKYSVGITPDFEDGRVLLLRLVAAADVLLTDLSTEDRLDHGLDEASMRLLCPTLVVTQVTPFGASGPYASLIATHDSESAVAGAWTDVGPAQPVRPRMALPRKPADPWQIGSTWSALLAVAALIRAGNEGRGGEVDVSLAESVVAGSAAPDATALNEARITDRATLPPIDGGTDELVGAKFQHYETADDQVVLFGSAEPLFWRNFCEAAERPDLISTGADMDVIDFRRDDDDLRRELEAVFRTKTAAEWTRLANDRYFICSPAPRSLEEARDDPHLRSREIFIDVVHPAVGPIRYVGVPGVIRGHRCEVARPAPTLGQDTRAILVDLGMDADELDRLAQARTISLTGSEASQ